MSNDGEWCLIESDPGVFSDLIRAFGVKGVQVEEIWSLDEELLKKFAPVYGLIFLFKYTGKDPKDLSKNSSSNSSPQTETVFFAKQTISNACATLAIVNTLLNCDAPGVDIGETLKEYRSFTGDFDSMTRGLALSNCEHLRAVHNSFSSQTVFQLDESNFARDDDVFHFIGLVPHCGRLLELDGLKEFPVDHGEFGDMSWTEKALEVLRQKMSLYATSEVRFNLMALISDKLDTYTNQLESLMQQSTKETFNLNLEVARVKDLIEQEEERRTKQRWDNIRRKHNYLPLIIEMLQILGEKKALSDIYNIAEKKALDQKKKDK